MRKGISDAVDHNVYFCPKCNSPNVRVIDSRCRNDVIWRRRKCMDCNEKYTTYEIMAETYDRFINVSRAINSLESALKRFKTLESEGKDG